MLLWAVAVINICHVIDEEREERELFFNVMIERETEERSINMFQSSGRHFGRHSGIPNHNLLRVDLPT